MATAKKKRKPNAAFMAPVTPSAGRNGCPCTRCGQPLPSFRAPGGSGTRSVADPRDRG